VARVFADLDLESTENGEEEVMGSNVRPLSRLLALSGAGGVIGLLAVGGPIGIVGGILLGGLAEEAFARLGVRNQSDAHVAGDAGWGFGQAPPPPPPPQGGILPYVGNLLTAAPPYGQPRRPGVIGGLMRRGRGRDTLHPGQQLSLGQQITSPGGMYCLTLQAADGNLVLYKNPAPQGGPLSLAESAMAVAVVPQALWSPNIQGRGAVSAIMQTDGNFVVYGPSQNALWASGTSGQPGNRLTMQDDGNLVIYNAQNGAPWASQTVQAAGEFGAEMGWDEARHARRTQRMRNRLDPRVGVDARVEFGGAPSTASATGLKPGQRLAAGQQILSPSGAYTLAMQTDGNLALYGEGDQPIWSSNTAGSNGVMAVMQPSGALAVCDGSQNVLWSSGSGQPGSRLTVHDDGNLVVYSPMGIPAWQSNTAQAQT
jgi:hypothetical protein